MSRKYLLSIASLGFILLSFTGCVRDQSRIIIITATFSPVSQTQVPQQGNIASASTTNSIPPTLILSQPPPQVDAAPSPNPTREAIEIPTQHIVQPGDTLSTIAQFYGLDLQSIVDSNDILNPNVLVVGQIINLPGAPTIQTPGFKIVPDSRLVRAPGSNDFDIEAFINKQPGFIRSVQDDIVIRNESGQGTTISLTSAEIVERISILYSVDPRLLLALLEFRAGWLSNPNPREDLRTHPLLSQSASGIDRSGLNNQLAWAANELNRGYYGWKYRGNSSLQFGEGFRSLYDAGLNPGTVGLQYFLSLGGNTYERWLLEVDINGFFATYYSYFGDPFQGAIEPIIPLNLQQPAFGLPFESGVEWRYTGGPHGGWDSGSAWSSLDFAPSSERPNEAIYCFVAEEWVTAVAPGVIVRSGEGAIVLDLDGDGDESTGWVVNYLHLANTAEIAIGTRVATGDRLGQPSCAGGYSNATHLHISRKFNGEWIPADCQACLANQSISPFTLGVWRSVGIPRQEYQGYLQNGSDTIQAEQGRETTINRISG